MTKQAMQTLGRGLGVTEKHFNFIGCHTPLSAKVGTKFRRQVAVTQSV
jgi:hypothetical protein